MIIEARKFNGIVRPLNGEDLSHLQPILETWVRNMVTREIIVDEVKEDLTSLRESLGGKNGREYLVAQTSSNEVVGMMGLSVLKEPLWSFATTASPVELVNAYVHKDHRAGRGVGSSLVQYLVERATDRGFTEILLDSGLRYRNTGWGFWDRQPGFRRIGLAKRLYDPRWDTPVWQKLLV